MYNLSVVSKKYFSIDFRKQNIGILYSFLFISQSFILYLRTTMYFTRLTLQLLLVLLSYDIVAAKVLYTNCLDIIVDNALRDMTIYEITLFYYNIKISDTTREQVSVIEKLVERIPLMIFNFTKPNMCNETTLSSSILSTTNRRISSLYIILFKEKNEHMDSFHEIKAIIDYLVQLSNKDTRSKLLMITFGMTSKFKHDFYNVFKYAWFNKILDFTIVQKIKTRRINTLVPSDQCIVQYYNPFYNAINKNVLDDKTNIFPDKLKNVNGYKIKLAVISGDGVIKIIKDREGKIIDVKSTQIYITTMILKIMHFSLEFVEVGKNKSFGDGIRLICETLMNNEANLHAEPKISTICTEVLHLNIDGMFSKMVAAVPVISNSKLKISLDAFGYFIFSQAMLASILYFLSIFKIQRSNWTFFEVVQIFLNISLTHKPTKFTDQILFLSFVLGSTIFSFYIYASFLQFQLSNEEIAFDTFESIDQSDLKFYTFREFLNYSFMIDSPYVRNLKKKALVINTGMDDCMEKLIRKQDRICHILDNFINRVNWSRIDPQYSSKFKIAKPAFIYFNMRYSFERASPYIKKFQVFLRIIEESGIRKKIHSNTNNKKKMFKNNDTSSSGSLTVLQLVSVLLCGSVLSIIIFCVECKTKIL